MQGLFITATDTGVGKTYFAALLCEHLRSLGVRVGAYKPVASGCQIAPTGEVVSEDGQLLWSAAGKPLAPADVCPQRFVAPLAPHLAAAAEGRRVDPALLRRGVERWRGVCDLLVVEGAGGLLSPLSETDSNADLARDLGLPLVVVAPNRLGVLNATLLTLLAAETLGLSVAGVVLNDGDWPPDASAASNPSELERLSESPLLAHLPQACRGNLGGVDWCALARPLK